MNHRKAFLNVHLVAILLATLGFSSVAGAGTIFVSGDTNIVNPLAGTSGAPVDLGNQQFFMNVLGGGSNVLVLQSVGVDSTANADVEVDAFYNTQAGISSSLHSGDVTAGSLAGIDLFFSPLPDDLFSDAEIAALSGFLLGGGTIFFTGENIDVQLPANDVINAALAALVSGITIDADSFDPGFHTTVPNPDPFTAGVASFTYAASSRVLGGTALFNSLLEGQTILAYETTDTPVPAPEPGTLLLLGAALMALCHRRRR